MLTAAPLSDIRSIGKFLSDSGYDSKRLAAELDLTDSPFATGENLQPLLTKTEGDSVLSVLARLFFVGGSVEASLCARVIPEPVLRAAQQCGLFTSSNGAVEAAASIKAFRNVLVAFDCPRVRFTDPDTVGGPGVASEFLARLTAGGENETTLDLGTGSGVLAVEAAAYSRSVVGADINQRSQLFAHFTAALNGVSNTEFMTGDTFAPVAGRRFTRIIANPPFFLTPVKTFVYSDSPLLLDGFARRIAKEAPAYLEDGGYFQMICQWVEVEGEAWEKRLRDWVAGSQCDVLVLAAPQTGVVAYAEQRDREARQAHSHPEFDFKTRLAYLRDRNVKKIHSGVISMRKRTGMNWFQILSTVPAGDAVGASLRQRFETITFLSTHDQGALLGASLRLAPDVQLLATNVPIDDAWRTVGIELLKTDGLVDRLRLDEPVAACLPLFDGRSTLAEVSANVAARLKLSADDAQRNCLQLARRLLHSSFLLPEPANS